MNDSDALAHWLGERQFPAERSMEEFRSAVRAQLIKDFQWDRERVEAARIELVQLLKDEIEWGMERDATALFASFYRLDLGEKVIREVLDSHERPAAYGILAERSLERAAMKVWMRWTFGALTTSSGASR